MESIINIVKEWPIIIQGALGSGLFWLILLLGQKVADYTTRLYSKHSVKSRKSWLTNRAGKILLILSKKVDEQSHYSALLLYRSSRYLFKALMWLVLGLILQIILQPAAIISYLGCLYYLIQGYSVVTGTSENETDLQEELKNITKELKSLG